MRIGAECADDLTQLAHEVAASCSFQFIPPIYLRRGKGGDWDPVNRHIRIGRAEMQSDHDRLWYLLAHEIAHAQGNGHEGHSRSFWVRLADGLRLGAQLGLLRYDFGYREGALLVAEEYGVPDVPPLQTFRFAVADVVKDSGGKQWKVYRRFRKAGVPHYRLATRGWRWVITEEGLLKAIR
ncbi:MAG: hypothetical protein EXR53_00790 [Dehalococcoidia bacterium]|nr:hypothetical protein [Dehalococcoidia bacterium]